MRNPYEVLGLSPGASDEQVRDAYRRLARQYSDDSPASQQARREIDEAYDAIILNRTGNGGSGYTQQSYNNQHAYTVEPDYSSIRASINSGSIDEADRQLDSVPVDRRNAEWHYLKGTVHHRRGWLEEAAASFGRAHKMEPNNAEYRRAYNNTASDRSGGYRTESKEEKSGCSSCQICSGLLCADCCCESMGGDLIPCC